VVNAAMVRVAVEPSRRTVDGLLESSSSPTLAPLDPPSEAIPTSVQRIAQSPRLVFPLSHLCNISPS
jgi:hypothetical protein